MSNFEKYGHQWNKGTSALEVEFYMVRKLYDEKNDELLNHYLNVHKLLWPEDEQHRWFKLGLKSIVQNKISIFLGSASSGKTYLMACHALMDFFIFPRTSLALISSTERRSLELKVFGRVKELFNRARKRYDFLDGFVLDSAMSIIPDETDDNNETARELNKGIICVPCVSGGRFVGMGKFQGAKAPNTPGKFDGILKSYMDELAVMQPSILDGFVNWTVNPRFKGVGSANPTDISDPACIASEPEGGWDSFIDTKLTQEWKSKWYGAHVVAFDGRDTPNNDFPGIRYPFLISSDFINELKTTHGEDSWQFYQQGIGKPSRGMVSNRVITVQFCENHLAFQDVVWASDPVIKLAAIDLAYGTGDRCVWREGEIGPDVAGRQILNMLPPEIIPIKISTALDPEAQIADFVHQKSEQFGIRPEHIFFDSFGKGTISFYFAKLFGSSCPIPVNSGGPATERPARFDLFVTDKGEKRLKRCNEEYDRLITELWFSVREAIHSEQVRGLGKDVAMEGQLRLYEIISRARIKVETKDDMKERVKKSPDLFDATAILVEGARRLGFKIQRIGIELVKKQSPPWWREEGRKQAELQESKMLQGA